MQSTPERLPAGSPEEAGRLPPYGVLVVDDESDLRLVLCRALCAAGYRVWDAASGADALKIAAERDGDVSLLVTDLKMPGMNGRELADEIASRWPGIRVLYISGFAECTLPPGASFLAKPFRVDALKREIERLLGQPDSRAHCSGT